MTVQEGTDIQSPGVGVAAAVPDDTVAALLNRFESTHYPAESADASAAIDELRERIQAVGLHQLPDWVQLLARTVMFRLEALKPVGQDFYMTAEAEDVALVLRFGTLVLDEVSRVLDERGSLS